MSQIIVLGWDALDVELIHRYGLGDSFGAASKIDTIVNLVVGEPHTLELWPTLISGQRPTDHGIRAATPGSGVEWDSTTISLAADLAAGVVPQSMRTAIGRWLRERGAGIGMDHAAEFPVATVFDDGGKAISIPNYQTAADREHGLDAARNSVWKAIVPDRSVDDGIEPQVSLPTVWQTISGAAGDRLGHTLAALEAGHDLVWCWFGLLDTIGHIQPAMDADLERRGYELAAAINRTVRQAAPEDAIVLSLSDHGLQDGAHTHYATLATDCHAAHDAIDDVTDVRPFVERQRGDVDASASGYEEAAGEQLHDDLEALGYL